MSEGGALREVAAILSVDADAGPLAAFMGIVDKAKGAMAALAAAFAIKEVAEFVDRQLEAAEAVSKVSERLGVSTDTLQRFQYALRLTGGDAEGAANALFFLEKAIGAAAKGGDNPFAALGVKVKDASGHVRDAIPILSEVADKVAKAKSGSEQTAIAVGIFGRGTKEILPLLKRGAEGVRELSEEYDDLGGGIRADYIKAAVEAREATIRNAYVMEATKVELVAGFAPAITAVSKVVLRAVVGFREWARSTSVFATSARVVAAVVGGLLLGKLFAFVTGGLRMYGVVNSLRFGIMRLGAAILSPVVAFALLYLAIDDLWVLMKGGDSVIGGMLDKLGLIHEKQAIVDALDTAWANIKTTWTLIEPLIGKIGEAMGGAATGGGSKLAMVFVGIAKMIAAATTLFSGFVAAISAGVSGDFDGALAKLNAAGDATFGKKNEYWDPTTGKMVSENVGGIYGADAGQFGVRSAAASGLLKPPASIVRPAAAASYLASGGFDFSQQVSIVVPPGTAPETMPGIVRAGVRDASAPVLRQAYAAGKKGAPDAPAKP